MRPRAAPTEFVNVWCRVTRVTDAAVRILIDDDDIVQVWIPKSQLKYPDQAKVTNDVLCLAMTAWIATQKGLI